MFIYYKKSPVFAKNKFTLISILPFAAKSKSGRVLFKKDCITIKELYKNEKLQNTAEA